MMVRTLRTGKRLPLRLDELPRQRLDDHRGSKWRESMTVTTNGAASKPGPNSSKPGQTVMRASQI
jgi:hypothetical protein